MVPSVARIAPEVVDELAGCGCFDLIINEADGSRMRSFKAPAGHEPVIPASTTLVTPVVGMDVLGQALTDETVHRANLVSQLSGTGLGQPVTLQTIAGVLCHSQGGLKNVPAKARLVPLLNKVSTPTGLTAARELAAKLLMCERIAEVVIGSAHAADNPVHEVHGRTAAIILAAGGSSRFGSPKQLARWGEQTFIERVVELALASPARPVMVVLGAEAEQCLPLLKDKPVEIVMNKEWASGQSTSMKVGLAALPPQVNSAVFMLADLPGLSSTIIEALIQRHRQTLAPVIWPEFQGQRGNPILFDRTLFAELQQIRGDTGGRPLLKTYQDQAERVAVEDAGILLDFDRAEDLAAYSAGPL